jgi:hypothetical protein
MAVHHCAGSIFLQAASQRHQKPGAVPALHSAMSMKASCTACSSYPAQGFDQIQLHVRAGRDKTRHHGFAVQEHSACTAFTFSAAFLCADQISFFAQQSQQGFVVSALEGIFSAVDGCFN